MENKIRRGEWRENNKSEVTGYEYYADPLVEVLLLKCKDAVEQAVGKKLLPSYSFSRIYQPGEELSDHIDREACEISVTVNVASKGEISSFYTEYKDNQVEQHVLNPGDAVIYKGCEVHHWRSPLKTDQLVVQFMLHYVDINGPYKAFEKDTRTMLGLPAKQKRIQ